MYFEMEPKDLAFVKQIKEKDENGKNVITERYLRELCEENGQYATPALNDALYLHYKGFRTIENLEAYTKYMDEFLNDTIISGEAVSVISTSHKTSIPQLKRWHRTGPCIGMEFNNNMVQINLKEEHVKIILWSFENELLITSLHDNRAMTLSLMTQSCELLPRQVRRVLDKAMVKLKDLLGISIRE